MTSQLITQFHLGSSLAHAIYQDVVAVPNYAEIYILCISGAPLKAKPPFTPNPNLT
jgi:hypothetical protein